jgi:multiple sugar transport system permease protein
VNEVRKAKTFFRMMYFIPAVAPGVAMTVLWKYIWQPDYGFANYILSIFNIPPQMWLNNPNLTIWCMYFPGLIMAGGMTLLIYLAAMQDVPEEHYEAAMIEGAGFIQKIRYITLPQIKPIIGIMFILDLIARFNEAQGPLIYTEGGPMGKTETMILYAYKAARTNLDYGFAISLANIVFALVFILTAVQMKMTSRED